MTIDTPSLVPGADTEPAPGAEALIKEARRGQRRRQALAGTPAPGRAAFGVPLGDTPVSYTHLPAYYAYAVQGSIYALRNGPMTW